MLRQRISKGRTSDKHAVLLPHPSNSTSLLRWIIRTFMVTSSNLSRDSNKFYITTYYTTCYRDSVHSRSLPSPEDQKDKFCNRCIKEH